MIRRERRMGGRIIGGMEREHKTLVGVAMGLSFVRK